MSDSRRLEMKYYDVFFYVAAKNMPGILVFLTACIQLIALRLSNDKAKR